MSRHHAGIEMKKLLLAAALLGAPVAIEGQTVVGTDPNAELTAQVWSEGAGQGILQTFKAAGDLASVTVWVDMGQRTSSTFEGWFGRLMIVSGTTPFENVLRRVYIPFENSGEFTASFAAPISMVAGDIYSIHLFFNNCAPEGGIVLCPLRMGDTHLPLQVRLTASDAYSEGAAFSDGDGREYPGDVAFRATFTVPEPSIPAALLIGMAGLAMRARRRDHTTGTTGAITP
jgi:hypothetical protein